jgi:hypothetical protein
MYGLSRSPIATPYDWACLGGDVRCFLAGGPSIESRPVYLHSPTIPHGPRKNIPVELDKSTGPYL